MPDIFDNLTPVGVPTIPGQGTIDPLPAIEFKDLPAYKAPNFFAPGTKESAGIIGDFGQSLFQIKSDSLSPLKFNTYSTDQEKKFKHSDAYKDVGFNPGWENPEAVYDLAQGKGEAAWNTLVKFVNRTGNTFAHTFMQNFDSVSGIAQADMAAAWKNNPNLRQLKDQEDIENLYPTFMGAAGTRWYNFIPFTKGSADFYENFIPQLGFTAGTLLEVMAENAVIDVMTGGAAAPGMAAKGSRRLYDAISQMYSLKKGEQLVNSMTGGQRAVNGLKTGIQMWNMYNAAASEASFEAVNNYGESIKRMLDEFKATHGRVPSGTEYENIKAAAVEAGNNTYKANIPLLMASNWIQFKGIMMPEFAKAEAMGLRFGENKFITDALTNEIKVIPPTVKTLKEIWKTGSTFERTSGLLGLVGKSTILRGALPEGLEEVNQRFISESTKQYASDKVQGKASKLLAGQAAISTIFSEDGLNEFIGGALGGGVFQGIGSIAKRVAGAPTDIKDEQGNVTGTKMGFLNRLGLFPNSYLNTQKATAAQNLATMLNHEKVLDLFKEQGVRDLFGSAMNLKQIQEYLAKNDLFNFANVKSSVMNRLLFTGFATGKIGLRMDQLTNLLQMDSKTIAEQLEVEDIPDLKAKLESYVNSVKARIPEFEKIYDSETKRFEGALGRAFRNHGMSATALFKAEDNIKKKYGVTDPEDILNEYWDKRAEFVKRMDEAKDDIEKDKILEEADKYSETQKERVDDYKDWTNKNTSALDNAIAYQAVQEGRKYAVFAASDALDSAKRGREIIAELRRGESGSRFGDIERLMSVAGVLAEEKRLGEHYRMIARNLQMAEEATMVEKKRAVLKDMIDSFGLPETTAKQKADKIYEYLSIGDESTTKVSSPFVDSYHWDVNKDAIKSKLEDLFKLQNRHDINLELFRFLENDGKVNDDFMAHQTKVMRDFLAKVTANYLEELAKAGKPDTIATAAEFKLGKIGNTEYEAKADGIYYKDTKLENPESKSDKEIIEAHIKDRRENDLKTAKDDAEKTTINKKYDDELEEVRKAAEEAKVSTATATTTTTLPAATSTTQADDEAAALAAGVLPIPPSGSTVVVPPTAEELAQQQVDALKQKLANGGQLTAEDLKNLLELSAANKDAAELYNSFLNSQKLPFKPGELVTYKGEQDTVETIERDKADPTKFWVTLSADPDNYIDSAEVFPASGVRIDTNAPGFEYFDPEGPDSAGEPAYPQHTVAERTTVDEIEGETTADRRKEDKKDIPQLVSSKSMAGFKQNFLNMLAATNRQGDYQFFLVQDSIDNYEPGSPAYEALKKDPRLAGLALQVIDNSDNDRFDDDFLPDKKGRKLMYSFVAGEEKKQLLAAMKAHKVDRIPVSLKTLTQGAFKNNEGNKMLPTHILTDGVDPTTYDLFIAVSRPRGAGRFQAANGAILMNGRFYIEASGSYIQLSPTKIADMKIGGKSFDILSLIDRTYASFPLAENVRNFLSNMIYTDGEDGISFHLEITPKGTKIVAVRNQGGLISSRNQKELKKELLDRRMNITKGLAMNAPFKFYYIDEKSNLQDMMVPSYRNHVIENSTANKKAFMQDGQKVLKPIDRAVVLDQSFKDLRDLVNANKAGQKTAPAQPTVVSPTIAQMKAEFKLANKKDEINNAPLLKDSQGVIYYIPESVVRKAWSNDTSNNGTDGNRPQSVERIIQRGGYSEGEMDTLYPEWRKEVAELNAPKQEAEVPVDPIVAKLEELIQYGVLNTQEAAMARANPREYLRYIAMQINNINAGGEFNKGHDSRDQISTKEIADELRNMANTMYPEYKQIADEADKGQTTNNEALTKEQITPSSENKTEAQDLEEKLKAVEARIARQNDRDKNKRKGLFRKITKDDGTRVDSAEVQFIIDRFGEDVLLKVRDIIDTELWGQWTRAGIALYKNATSGTGYHESWHYFSQLYMSVGEKQRLYGEQRRLRLGLANATDMEIEEQVAEDFRKYAQSNGLTLPTGTETRSIFAKIWAFIKRMFGYRDVSLDKLFNDLYRGKLRSYSPSINNAMWDKLNSRIVTKGGMELFDNRRGSRYLRYMDSLLGQFMSSNRYPYSLLLTKEHGVRDEKLQEAGDSMWMMMYKQKKELDEKETEYFDKNHMHSPMEESRQDLQKLLENFDDVYNHYTRAAKYVETQEGEDDFEFTLTAEDEDAQDENPEVGAGGEIKSAEDEKVGKEWDKTGNEQSVIEAATEESKSFIRALSKVEVDENGMPKIVDGKVQLAKDVYGLTQTVDFSQVFNNLAILLEGSHSYEEVQSRMNNKENQRKIPELALILERLPARDEIHEIFDVMQLTTFCRDFTKTYIPIFSLVKKTKRDGTVEYFMKEETRRTREQIEKTWRNAFMTKAMQNEDVLKDENGRPYLNKAIRFSYDFKNTDDVEQFLDDLGLSFSDSTKSSTAYKDLINNKNVSIGSGTTLSIFQTLQDTLNQILETDETIYSPYDALNAYRKSDSKIKSEKNILGYLLDLEAKYTNLNPSMSFRTSTGELAYGLSENNWQTNNVYWLSKTANYKQIMSNPNTQHLNIYNNPNVGHSLFLQRLFHLEGARFGQRRYLNNLPVTVILGNYNGTKDDNEQNGETSGKATTDLYDRDKLIMDVIAMHIAGIHEGPRTESSKSAFFQMLSNYSTENGRQEMMPIPMNKVGTYDRLFDNAQFDEIIRGYFEDEVGMIVNKFDSPLEDYYATDTRVNNFLNPDKQEPLTNPGRFSLFMDILGKNDAIEIQQALIKASKGMDSEQKKTLIKRAMDKYGDRAVKDTSEYLRKAADKMIKKAEHMNIKEADKEKIFPKSIFTSKEDKGKGTRAYSLKEVLSSFLLNDFILNVEYTKLFSGSTAYYKSFHKRSKSDTSTGSRGVTDGFVLDYLRNTHEMTLQGSLGMEAPTDLTTTKTLVIKDIKKKSAYVGSDSIYVKTLMALNPGWTAAEAEKLLGKRSGKSKGYYNMTVTDGQGHCTLDFYRSFRIAVGNWFPKDEIMYKKEVITFRRQRNLYANLSETQREADDNYMEVNKDVVSYFPSMKVQHNGPLAGEQGKGGFTPIFDKFSINPLIPSVVGTDTTWGKVYESLIKSGVGYTKFESGTKKYAFHPVDLYSDNFDGELQKGVHEVFTENLKEQIKTNGKVKDDSTWGTQMRKLFLTNMFSGGVAKNDNIARIYEDYKKMMKNLVDKEKTRLFKEFGVTQSPTGELTIGDTKRFVRTIQKQVDARSLNDNIRDSIQYDKSTGKILYPLEILNNKSAIQDLIAGLIDKRITKIQVNGDMLIQVSNGGYERYADFSKFTHATEEDIQKYGTTGLRFYSMTFDDNGIPVRTRAMDVKVALTGDFKGLLNLEHPDGKKIGTLERLNKLLKNERWTAANKEKLTIVGYRIPTQGPNSMEIMQVAEFLPSVAGSIIIVPDELVAKSGGDFDIDKLSIFRPSLTASGEYISKSNIEGLRNQLKGLEKQYQDIRALDAYYSNIPTLEDFFDKLFSQSPTGQTEDVATGPMTDITEMLDTAGATVSEKMLPILKEFNTIRDAEKKLITNQIMDAYEQILTSPEMFTALVTPNDTDLVQNKANELDNLYHLNLGDFRDTAVYTYENNLIKFKQLLAGKRLLSRFALANTFSQLLQQSGMTINKNYSIIKDVQGIPTKFEHAVTLNLFSPEEQLKLLKSDGSIDFSSAFTVDGMYKQEFFSQLINATVDIAADPYFAALGIDNETVNVAIYLLLMGCPFDRMINFINQPIIKRYMFKRVQQPNNKDKTFLQAMLLGGIKADKVIPYSRVSERKEALDLAVEKDGGFDVDELDKMMRFYARNTLGFTSDAKDNLLQQKIFAHFLKLDDQSTGLRDLMMTSNFDTAKFLGATSVMTNLMQRDDVNATGLFNKEAVDKIRNNSLISAFNNLHVSLQIFRALMPIGSSNTFTTKSAEILARQGKTKTGRVKLERLLNNDWIEFIIKNFAKTSNGEQIEQYGKSMIEYNEDTISLSDRLLALKNEFEELVETFTFLKRLLPNISSKQPKMRNVELYRGLDNTSDFQNILIEEYRALRNFTLTDAFTHDYDTEQIERLHKFMDDLKYAAFYESGFNRSPISFMDIIPYEELADTFKTALESYQDFIKRYPGSEKLLVDIFGSLFELNNPKFATNVQNVPDYIDPHTFTGYNPEGWRGKNYSITEYATDGAIELKRIEGIGDPNDMTSYEVAAETRRLNAPPEHVVPLTTRYTRASVERDGDFIYLFTDNAGRTSGKSAVPADGWYQQKYGQGKTLKYPGKTQAMIRGLENAFPITTMVDDKRTQWTDDRLEEYKSIIDDEVSQIKAALPNFKGIKYSAENPFGKGEISDMKQSAPKIWEYMNNKLLELGIDNREKAETTQVPEAVSPSNVEGEEINSAADNLAFALTNPVFTTPKGYEWKRRNWSDGQTAWRNYMKKGILFQGVNYRDVEDAYQKNKSKYPVGEPRDAFMQSLIEIKLRTYPKLMEGIKAKGGVAYLENSTHRPTRQKSHWETDGDNAFIKVLSAAYKNVLSDNSPSVIPINPTDNWKMNTAPGEVFKFSEVRPTADAIVTTSDNLSDYTNHSGGADGSDFWWDKIGQEFGMTDNRHYWAMEKTPHGNTEISAQDYEEGRFEAAKAAKRNFGYQYQAMKDSRLIRNWSQVKYADAVFAIGRIVDEGEKLFPDRADDTRFALVPTVSGGTGYAVSMAINHNKPVYVFNQVVHDKYPIGWYRWTGEDFMRIDVPVLTKNFAGVGTRNINNAGMSAIRAVYQRTLAAISPESKAIMEGVTALWNQYKDKILAEKPNSKLEDMYSVALSKGISFIEDHLKNCYG